VSAIRTRRPSKYRNVPVVVDGVRFASKAEAKRWEILCAFEQAGLISKLERQVRYILAPKVKIAGEKRARSVLRFTADFRYVENGQTVVEDSKGYADTAFRIRQHLMKSIHGVDVRLS